MDKKLLVPLSVAFIIIILAFFLIDVNNNDNNFIIIIIPLAAFIGTILLFSIDNGISSPKDKKRYDAKVLSIDNHYMLKIEVNGGINDCVLEHVHTLMQGQDGSERGLIILKSMLTGKYTQVVISGGYDNYGNDYCRLYIDGKDAGEALISKGYAWIDTNTHVPLNYIEAFLKARKSRQGVFKDEKSISPNQYINDIKTKQEKQIAVSKQRNINI